MPLLVDAGTTQSGTQEHAYPLMTSQTYLCIVTKLYYIITDVTLVPDYFWNALKSITIDFRFSLSLPLTSQLRIVDGEKLGISLKTRLDVLYQGFPNEGFQTPANKITYFCGQKFTAFK